MADEHYVCEGALFNPTGDETDATGPVEYKAPSPHQPGDSDIAVELPVA